MPFPEGPSKSKKVRADALMLQLGLVDSIDRARRLILAGEVRSADCAVTNPSQLLPVKMSLQLRPRTKWVSRGGAKLESVIIKLELSSLFLGKTVLDIGASTGGFTDCALSFGAERVLALDVGRGHLAWKLRTDPRVCNLENTDVRDFKPQEHPPIDIVLADISFNSIQRLAPSLLACAPRGGATFLILVKPQFELRREEVPVGGVVTSPAAHGSAVAQAKAALQPFAKGEIIVCTSDIVGRYGNREFFLYFNA